MDMSEVGVAITANTEANSPDRAPTVQPSTGAYLHIAIADPSEVTPQTQYRLVAVPDTGSTVSTVTAAAGTTNTNTQSTMVEPVTSPPNPKHPPQLLVVIRQLKERIGKKPSETHYIVEDTSRLMFARARVENMTYEVCVVALLQCLCAAYVNGV